MDPMATIVGKLHWITRMVLIIRSCFPLSIFGRLIFTHEQANTVILYGSNCAVWDVAIFMEKVAFLNHERVLVDVGDVAHILLIRRVDMHVCVKMLLVPV